MNRARALADAFGRLRDAIAGVDTQSTMHAVTAIAVSEVAGCDWASITRKRGQTFQTTAATDDRARRADILQYEVRSGPCVDAIDDDHVYVTAHISDDARWPVYGPRVRAEVGVDSMLSYRLRLDDDAATAALNLYSQAPNAFDESDMAVGLLLATHGALAMTATSNRERADNLSIALQSNRDIGIAIGVIMTRHKVTRDQAFDLLRISSQRSHRKLYDLALDTIETGDLTLYDPTQPGPPRPAPGRQG